MLMSKMVVVQEMLVGCADFNAQNGGGVTALICAARNGYTKIARLLIADGADVNAISRYGSTALMCAAKCGHTEIEKLLRDSGAV